MAKNSIFKQVRELYLQNRQVHIEYLMKKLNLTRDEAVIYLLWVKHEEQ